MSRIHIHSVGGMSYFATYHKSRPPNIRKVNNSLKIQGPVINMTFIHQFATCTNYFGKENLTEFSIDYDKVFKLGRSGRS